MRERIIIIMEICKVPTLRLKALNKHTHIMYIEMEMFNFFFFFKGFKYNYAKDAHTHTVHTSGVKNNVA